MDTTDASPFIDFVTKVHSFFEIDGTPVSSTFSKFYKDIKIARNHKSEISFTMS